MEIIEKIDKCAFDTKIIFLLIVIVVFIGAFYLIKAFTEMLNVGINLEKFFAGIRTLARIIKDYELKTIAGLINLSLSILLLLVTLGVFLSTSIASFLGFDDNIAISKILFVCLTCVTTLASIWVLHKYDVQTRLTK